MDKVPKHIARQRIVQLSRYPVGTGTMSETAKKKAREILWLERFVGKSGLQLAVDDNRDDKERPDFLVRYEGRLVGVEVTELQIDRDRTTQKGSALQKTFSLQQDVVSRAQQLYSATDSTPINTEVYFRGGPTQAFLSVHSGNLAQALVQVLCQISLSPLERRKLDHESNPPVPKPVVFVYALGLPVGITPLWQVVAPGWSRAFEASTVESLLTKKNALIGEYRKTVAENWLLMVADGTKPPGMFHAPEENDIDLPASKFDRTFFLCEPDGLLIEWPARSKGRITTQ